MLSWELRAQRSPQTEFTFLWGRVQGLFACWHPSVLLRSLSISGCHWKLMVWIWTVCVRPHTLTHWCDEELVEFYSPLCFAAVRRLCFCCDVLFYSSLLHFVILLLLFFHVSVFFCFVGECYQLFSLPTCTSPEDSFTTYGKRCLKRKWHSKNTGMFGVWVVSGSAHATMETISQQGSERESSHTLLSRQLFISFLTMFLLIHWVYSLVKDDFTVNSIQELQLNNDFMYLISADWAQGKLI